MIRADPDFLIPSLVLTNTWKSCPCIGELNADLTIEQTHLADREVGFTYPPNPNQVYNTSIRVLRLIPQMQ